MNRLLCLTALTLLLAAPAAADDDAALRSGRAWVLAHEAVEAWELSLQERDSKAAETLRLDLFAFAGSARLAAERLSQPDIGRADQEMLFANLEELAELCQASVFRARYERSTRDAWAEARNALADLVEGAPARVDDSGAREPAREPTPEPEPEPQADPNDPRPIITETRWSGTFTPDLVVSGRIEGRGLKSGALVLLNSSGRELKRWERELNEAILSATSGGPADGLATASFSIRIDDDTLASGENTVVLRVVGYEGRTAETSKTVTKRLF